MYVEMIKYVTLNDQVLIIGEMIEPLSSSCTDDPCGAYQQCKNVIAECELLLDMLKKLKSDIEYDLLDLCESPDNYWDI